MTEKGTPCKGIAKHKDHESYGSTSASTVEPPFSCVYPLVLQF